MFENQMERRTLLAVAAAGGLAACGMVRKSPFFSTIATFNKSPTEPVSREKIEALAYASIVAWFDGSTKALLVLGEYKPENRLVWYSAEHQALTTWGPFVLGLVGTEVGLRSSSLTGQWNTDLRSMVGRKVGRTLDFQAPSNRATIATTSTFNRRGHEIVDLVGDKRSLLHIQERVRANGWHTYRNDYWIDDQTGVCWKSRQLVVPTMAKLNIVIGKMPRGSSSAQ